MVETLGYRGKWIELGKELESAIRQNNNLPKEERKSLNSVFEDFAEKHDTTANSTSRYYYNEVKPKLDEEESNPVNIDESINRFVNSDLKDPRSIYKIGENLEINIVSIHDFGVFGRTKEGFQGLIHISEITGREFVEMPEDFFYVGEKVLVRLKRFDTDGKMHFSTRAIGGKKKVNPAFKDIASASVNVSPTKVVEQKAVRIEPIIEQTKPIQEVKVTPAPSVSSNDRNNIIDFIKKYSDNNASQQALADIDEMIAENGVFQTTIALMEVVRDLDISSFITNLAKEKLDMDGDLLRRS